MREGGAVPSRAVTLVVGVLACLAVLLVPSAPASAAGPGSASVSDTTPLPGQTVTVRASGLKPGGVSYVDYLPDAIRLATVTVGDDGSYSRNVQIPAGTKDGPKQIVVTAVGADGKYAYLPTDLRVTGPPATARLSTDRLFPRLALRVEGTRFLSGTEVSVVLFPEAQSMGSPRAGRDGRLSAEVVVPGEVLNGRHVVVVAGLTAGGGYAYLQIETTMTGGVGDVPAGDVVVPGAGYDPTAVTSTSFTVPTTKAPTVTRGTVTDIPPTGDGFDGLAILLLVVLVAIVLGIGVGSLLLTPAGRRWIRQRRRRFRRWRARRSR